MIGDRRDGSGPAQRHARAFVFARRHHDNEYTRLQDLRTLTEAVDTVRADIVHGMRKEGATWEEIGDALSVSRQAAHAWGARHGIG